VTASQELKRLKRALRTRVRALRDALEAAERALGSRSIATAVLELPEVRAISTAMVFASFGSEVDTMPIVEGLLDRGVRVALPRVEGADLVPIAFRAGDPLVEAAFGMPEPAAGEHVPPLEIDLAVTPGLAFDRTGRRVGYGGGFYDRFFATARPGLVKVAVCFAVQLVDEVPHGAHDVAVDVVVTEREVLRPGRGPGAAVEG
jgi:5-formyltetrahydrofolate cyclo-ligase